MTLKYVCQEAQSCIRLENREEQERKREHILYMSGPPELVL